MCPPPPSAVAAPAAAAPSIWRTWEDVDAAPPNDEKAALLDFRAAIAPAETDPLTALRFLRARDLDTAKAQAMFTTCFEWRATERIDGILTEETDPAIEAAVATAFAPTVLKGKDKLGRPIVYTALGTIDLPALAKKGATLEQLLRCANREMERMRLEVEASADPLAGHLLIQDLRGCTVMKFVRSMKFWLGQGYAGQNYYPELLGNTIAVRGPPAAAWAVNTVKKFIDKKTGDKIELHSGEPAGPLSAYLDPDVLSECMALIDAVE